jgi:hypothetical protein
MKNMAPYPFFHYGHFISDETEEAKQSRHTVAKILIPFFLGAGRPNHDLYIAFLYLAKHFEIAGIVPESWLENFHPYGWARIEEKSGAADRVHYLMETWTEKLGKLTKKPYSREKRPGAFWAFEVGKALRSIEEHPDANVISFAVYLICEGKGLTQRDLQKVENTRGYVNAAIAKIRALQVELAGER